MPLEQAKPNQIIELPLRTGLCSSRTTTVAQTADLELIRLVLPAGKLLPTHKAPGEITVQCLEGRVAFTAKGKTQELTEGQLLYLAVGEPHSLKAIEDSSLLVTRLLLKSKLTEPFDVVQEASEESFPASDPPAY